MTSLSFFTAVRYGEEHQKNIKQYVQEGIEGYFYLSGKSAYIIPNKVLDGSQEVEIRHKNRSKFKQVVIGALKVVSYITLVIPLIMIISKAIFRGTHKFHTISINSELPSHDHLNHHVAPVSVTPIDLFFTQNKLITEQRNAHNTAKEYLQKEARKIGAEVVFVSPVNSHICAKVDEVKIKKDLNTSIFTWENTQGVQGDIQRDGKVPGNVVLYGVASQFNSCEATARFTPQPGTAVNTYKSDPTQGPGAQLQFPDQQVEIINDAANLGFNGLCQVLDDTTKTAVKHGYLTPETKESAEAVIEQLQKNGDKMEFPCIGNIPKGASNTEKVYEILIAAPAFGGYSVGNATDNQKSEIEFLCALQGYRAQFQQAIQLATQIPKKQVVFKPTAPGLGVFGNRVENVAKAFYVAAKESESQLREKNIHVQLQVFRGGGYARNMANALGLNKVNI
jgi:hypothetical protein